MICFNHLFGLDSRQCGAQYLLKTKWAELLKWSISISKGSQISKQIDLNLNQVYSGSHGNSLRGGGCGASKQEGRKFPSRDYQRRKNISPPNYFMRDLKRHICVLIDRATLAYDEREKEQILISIQWFMAMQEHLNTLCKDTQSAAATYDIIFDSLPRLLIALVTYLRISGFLCLQILYIINDLGRVLFTFFMTNKDRFMKIKDKEILEELIADFETQLNIEAQNIWVVGAEYEITMIKAVVQNSPSNSDEGQKLLVSFIGGLVKSFLTMSPSDDLIDTLINGAKFLYKAYQINNLKKMYEIDYYFQSLKWQIIELLKQNIPTQNVINYLIHAYKNYIENSNDWILNFCWIKLIASLLSYRPILSKQEISDDLIEQSKIWNELIKLKYLSQFSFNKGIGRLELFQTNQNNLTQKISQVLFQFGYNSFENFNQSLLNIATFQPNKYFSLCDISLGHNERDYLILLFEKQQELDEYIEQSEKIFAEIKKQTLNMNENCNNLQKNVNQIKKQNEIQTLVFNLSQIINLSNCSLNQIIAIRNIKELFNGN